MQRLQLKFAILAAGKTQRRVAADSGITENRFSEIVCGWIDPTADERTRIAAVLNASPERLFSTERLPRECSA